MSPAGRWSTDAQRRQLVRVAVPGVAAGDGRDERTASAAVAGLFVTSTWSSAATGAFTAQPRSATTNTRDRNAREASR